MHSQVVHTKLGAVEYRSEGTGIPVLFLHGGHSNCYETLSHKGLDPEKFRLITPSRPGYGKTPLKEHRTPEQAADLIAALLEHLSLEQVIVYGISAGGLTAIALAANHPEHVKKLILASAVSKKWLDPSDPTYRTGQRIFHPRIEGFTWGMVRFFARLFPRLLAKSFCAQFSSQPPRTLNDTDIQEFWTALRHYRSHHGFLNDLDQDIEEQVLTRVHCPTLILHSRNDNSVPFEHALHAHDQIPQAQLVELHHPWGHLFWIGTASETAIRVTSDFMGGA